MRLDWLAEDELPITPVTPQAQPWKLLVVDDDDEVHRVTELALRNFRYEGRAVEVIRALTGEQARALAREHHDLAVIFLDVVMETEDAGLKVIDYIRNQLNNRLVRIIVRTGQAGRAPEIDVVARYDINGYREKTEMTSDKLMSQLYTSLSSYRDLLALSSEMRRREEADNKLLQQYAQLQAAHRRLQSFARAASHDLQEPLRKIGLWTDKLTGALQVEPGSKVEEAAGKLIGYSARISDLIDGLRQSYQLETQETAISTVQLNALFDQVLAAVNKKHEAVELQTEVDELGSIQGDADSLLLLFSTLIEEVALNNPEQKTAQVRIETCPAHEDDALCIHIFCQGQGIEPGELAKMFEPYSRAVINGVPSTGIGLYLCKRIVDANAGSIEVQSEAGLGTEITVRLPVASQVSV